jgi:hypothetical protein
MFRQNLNPQLLQVYDVLRAQACEREQRRGKAHHRRETDLKSRGKAEVKVGGKLPEKAFKTNFPKWSVKHLKNLNTEAKAQFFFFEGMIGF